jgi:aspartokinase
VRLISQTLEKNKKNGIFTLAYCYQQTKIWVDEIISVQVSLDAYEVFTHLKEHTLNINIKSQSATQATWLKTVVTFLEAELLSRLAQDKRLSHITQVHVNSIY